jgi:hypothetical protein
MKDRDREEPRENGTSDEPRKGTAKSSRTASPNAADRTAAPIDSPPPAHDELDTAE